MTVIKLDKRIKSIDDIQTILHFDVNCIGCKGYFFDEFIQTKDLSKCRYGELVDIVIDNYDLCFKAELENKNTIFFRFFIPASDLKPVEKYRAYTLEEFIGAMNLGELEPWIRMRPVGSNKECKFLYTGYQETEAGEYICLGCHQFDFISLFKNYEIKDFDGKWHPFGVKE